MDIQRQAVDTTKAKVAKTTEALRQCLTMNASERSSDTATALQVVDTMRQRCRSAEMRLEASYFRKCLFKLSFRMFAKDEVVVLNMIFTTGSMTRM